MDTYQLREPLKFEQLPTQDKIDYFTAKAYMYMPAGESTLHGVLVHGFRSCSALFPVC